MKQQGAEGRVYLPGWNHLWDQSWTFWGFGGVLKGGLEMFRKQGKDITYKEGSWRVFASWMQKCIWRVFNHVFTAPGWRWRDDVLAFLLLLFLLMSILTQRCTNETIRSKDSHISLLLDISKIALKGYVHSWLTVSKTNVFDFWGNESEVKVNVSHLHLLLWKILERSSSFAQMSTFIKGCTDLILEVVSHHTSGLFLASRKLWGTSFKFFCPLWLRWDFSRFWALRMIRFHVHPLLVKRFLKNIFLKSAQLPTLTEEELIVF